MRRVAAIAVGAVSALGEGASAIRAGGLGELPRPGLQRAPRLEEAGLRRTLAGLAPASLSGEAGEAALGLGEEADRASLLLAAALGQVLRALEAARPGFRAERIGVALGTSSGGMLGATRFFDALLEAPRAPIARLAHLARGATYFAPFEEVLTAAGLGISAPSVVRRTQVLAACAASTIAIGLGLRWLERGACDLVLTGGYDALSIFVASGFEALRATTASRPRPFRKGRDGMALGEGAAVVALVPEEAIGKARPSFFVCGFGASTDAVHITAPDRTGSGLARAAEAALADSGASPGAFGLVSAHATSTPFNDAAESRALLRIFPAGSPAVHAFKAQIGHALGAAGALEVLAVAQALGEGYLPATPTEGELDPDASAPLLAVGEPAPSGRPLALKLSAAFGGANAALVVAPASSPAEASPGRPRPPERQVAFRAGPAVRSADLAELSASTGVPIERLARLDGLGRLGGAAVAALAARFPPGRLAGAGVVVGSPLATLETNFGYYRRIAERGAIHAEPRVFPATSPQALAGECAILFGLTGPSFAVGASLAAPFEALARAAELVAYGECERVVVVSADVDGEATRAYAAALGRDPPEKGALAVLLEPLGPEGPDAALAPKEACRLPVLSELEALALDRASRAAAGEGPLGHLALARALEGLSDGVEAGAGGRER